MNLYIYNNLLDDPVIKNLLDWRENGNICGYYAACGGLLSAVAGVKGFVCSVLLENAPVCDISVNHAGEYFDHDIDEIYDHFFDFDWDGLCKKGGLLPLPEDHAYYLDSDNEKIKNAAALSDYQKTVESLINSQSSVELGDILIGFFNRYSCADEAKFSAFKWHKGRLCGVGEPDDITFDDLAVLGNKKDVLIENTRAFVSGGAAQDILLVGASGTGKSSCVKAAFNMLRPEGLKLVELFKQDISELPALLEEIKKRKRRYIIFIDDLSFDGSDGDYKALKVALDGQIERRPENMLIYATSNRLHLIRESWKDREGDEDVHKNDTLQEKMSLSERFGIRLYFNILSQPEYFEIVALLLKKHGIAFNDKIGKQAVAWEMGNNGRSGRTAKQFVTDYVAHRSKALGPYR